MASGKNQKWKEFKRVLFEKKKTNFITCIKCEELITHKKFSGTAPIVSHKCKIENQPKVDTFFKKQVPNINFNEIKKQLTDSIVKCCALDMRSFSFIEGEGFKLLAQNLIEVGAKFGRLKVGSIIPTAQTVSNRLPIIYDEMKEKLIKVTKSIGGLGVTLDLWKHDLTQAHYITVTGHYIKICSEEKNWKIMNCVLATREMTERQTGLNIKEKLDKVLDNFGLNHDNNYFVTDNARNMISACNERERYSCCGHNLNLVLKNTSATQMK
jgi:hypothetical protein